MRPKGAPLNVLVELLVELVQFAVELSRRRPFAARNRPAKGHDGVSVQKKTR